MDETIHKPSQEEIEKFWEDTEQTDKTTLTLEELDEIFLENFEV